MSADGFRSGILKRKKHGSTPWRNPAGCWITWAFAVRLEMHPNDPDYLQLMQDTGAEYVGRVFQWVYFRKKVADGAFDLFSDLDSRIAHLDRIASSLAIIGAANLVIGLTNTFSSPHLGWINLLCANVLMYGLGRIHGKRETLKAKRRLTE